jgi:hypothetical protein
MHTRPYTYRIWEIPVLVLFHSAILTPHLDINCLYGLKRAADFDRVDRAIY